MFRSYDDVMLEPQYSEIKSRSEISIAPLFEIGTPKLKMKMTTPIMSSPMDTDTGWEMAMYRDRDWETF